MKSARLASLVATLTLVASGLHGCADEVICGDGIVAGDEACDDGDDDDTNGCTTLCTLPVCGDGFHQPTMGEECDDGDPDDHDDCLSNCRLARCGDGVVSESEACDDANQNDHDACTAQCALAICGDGILWQGVEACDDANSDESDGCTSACALTSCGDGVVQSGEACDDGNQDNQDGCLNSCVLPRCGDGVLQLGVEACDDANQDDHDACTTSCVIATCGDGILRAGVEACDDGNQDESDGCTSACTLPSCGDGIVQAGEECDDGNANDQDACLSTCVSPSCGDGYLWLDQESCDDGNKDDHDACLSTCEFATCGDGVVQLGVELCDDGNDEDSDGCTSACTLPSCGDQVVQAGEECDDGNASDQDACLTSCTAARCGDGVLQVGVEACDDGNQDNHDTCTNQCALAVCGDGIVQAGVEACDAPDDDGATCTPECKAPTCGDGVVQPGEACDDGNASDHDACLTSCVLASCGDGVLQLGVEECDDGDADDHDACTTACLSAFCGDNIIQLGVEACDEGADGSDTCTAACHVATCGDGIVQAGEECDDGNASADDACLPSCLEARCGDGVVQAGVEACDDGDLDNNDPCTNSCALNVCGDGILLVGVEACDDASEGCSDACTLTSCGDGILQSGEGCDDGNLDDSDACLSTCIVASCGDGIVHDGVEACDDGNTSNADSCNVNCEPTSCGDGVVQAGEACDDANGDNTDACTNACLIATCGDGFVHDGVEQCDDGNQSDEDACTVGCKAAVCGDGLIHLGVEPCDDGNTVETDACLSSCAVASCGDGLIQAGVETCDDVNYDNTDGCLQSCASFDWCDSFVVSDIAPGASCSLAPADEVTLTALGRGFLTIEGSAATVSVNGIPTTASSPAGSCAAISGGLTEAQGCSELVVQLPPGLGLGDHVVTVTNPVTQVCTGSAVHTIGPPPQITTSEPPEACPGSVTLSVTGTGFGAGTTWTLGGIEASSSEIVEGVATLTFEGVPSGALGTSYPLTATNGAGCADTLNDAVFVVPDPTLFFVDPPVVFNSLDFIATIFVSGVNGGDVQRVALRESGSGDPFQDVDFTYDPADADEVSTTIPAGLVTEESSASFDVLLIDALGCPTVLNEGVVLTREVTVSIDEVRLPFGGENSATSIALLSDNDEFLNLPRVYLVGPAEVIELTATAFVSPGRLTTIVSKGLPVGSYDVVVINPDGSVGVSEADACELCGFQVNTLSPPLVDTVTPGSVPNNLQTLEVQGSGFEEGAGVTLFCEGPDGEALPPQETTVQSVSAEIIATDFDASAVTQYSSCVVRVTNPDESFGEFSAVAVTNSAENILSPTSTGFDLTRARRAPSVQLAAVSRSARNLYVLGGDEGDSASALSSIEFAPLDEFGNVSAPFELLDDALPEPRTMGGIERIGRFLYLVGGHDGTAATASVRRAEVLQPEDAPNISELSILFDPVGLESGVWFYRVSAVMAADDSDNPGGETLPSSVQPLYVSPLIPDAVVATLSWEPVAGASSYHVYRSSEPDQASGQERRIATVPATETSLVDNGLVAGPEAPREIGDLGTWRALPSLITARQGLGLTVARDPDPSDPNRRYLYAIGGRSETEVLGDYEMLEIDIEPDGSQSIGTWIAGGTFLAGGSKPHSPRWQLSAVSVDRSVASEVVGSNVFIYAGSGLKDNGTIASDVGVAQVASDGTLSGWLGALSKGPDAAGYGMVAAANQIFVFGGEGAAPSTDFLSGKLINEGASLQNFNAPGGSVLPVARYLPGLGVGSARIFLVGGEPVGGGATSAVTSTLW
ncbi:MAG: DUF4215 domain-containing protein [Myxococcota bacterium]